MSKTGHLVGLRRVSEVTSTRHKIVHRTGALTNVLQVVVMARHVPGPHIAGEGDVICITDTKGSLFLPHSAV